MTHSWRLEQTVITEDNTTHETTRYTEDRCGVCMNYIIWDEHIERWVHNNHSELCHDRAA